MLAAAMMEREVRSDPSPAGLLGQRPHCGKRLEDVFCSYDPVCSREPLIGEASPGHHLSGIVLASRGPTLLRIGERSFSSETENATHNQTSLLGFKSSRDIDPS